MEDETNCMDLHSDFFKSEFDWLVPLTDSEKRLFDSFIDCTCSRRNFASLSISFVKVLSRWAADKFFFKCFLLLSVSWGTTEVFKFL